MAISKERQVYLSVLILGLGALAADRLLVLDEGPASASAADLLVKSEASAAPVVAAVQGFPEKLRETASALNPEKSPGDAFMIPASWLPKPAAALTASEEPAPAPVDEEVPGLAEHFSLSSIAGSASGGVQAAVINGLLLSLGDRFNLHEGKAQRDEQGVFELAEVSASSVKIRVVESGKLTSLALKNEPMKAGRIQTRPRGSR